MISYIATIKDKKKVKHFYFTTVTALYRLEARMLAVDLSVLPPAKLVPTYIRL